MSAKVSFFPVDNGDMTLVTLADGSTILIDCNIRVDADDPKAECRDVSRDLRDRIKRDADGRPYVDVFLMSHPDQDHCRGIGRNFHLGSTVEYLDDQKKDHEKKILIREIWSSPIVFRRASKKHTLVDDAKAFQREAKRRIRVNREKQFLNVQSGDRIQILGQDIAGKTDDLTPILVEVDGTITKINGTTSNYFSALLLGPLPIGDEAEEALLSKNDSSVILNIQIAASAFQPDGCRFLTGGDAEVAIWEREWDRHQRTPEDLSYDLLQTPHHCSWHSLSYDSWSEKNEQAVVSVEARKALSQTRSGAIIVSSSKVILDNEDDPPCIRAKREYASIANSAKGKFYCTAEYPDSALPDVLEFEVTREGLQELMKTEHSNKSAAILASTSKPWPHG